MEILQKHKAKADKEKYVHLQMSKLTKDRIETSSKIKL
jgi:hypothetical protein